MSIIQYDSRDHIGVGLAHENHPKPATFYPNDDDEYWLGKTPFTSTQNTFNKFL